MRKIFLFIFNALLLVFSSLVNAEWMLTPSIGYSLGGKVIDQNSNKYNLDSSTHYAIALEMPYEKGRVGLFYSAQPTQVETLPNQDAHLHSLHFQSSIYYPMSPQLSSFLGLGIGGTYTDVSWADNKYGFSASAFGGLEYRIATHIALNAQLRWLGSMVDNDSSANCTLPSSENCVIKFKSDWLNQASVQIGLTIRL